VSESVGFNITPDTVGHFSDEPFRQLMALVLTTKKWNKTQHTPET